MIIRTQMTDNQLAEVLQELGYKTDMRDVTRWEKRGHNRDELVGYSRLHVIDQDQWVLAQPFFERLLDNSLIELIRNNKK
jgi:hypothetical protein